MSFSVTDRIGGADQPAGAADMTDPGLAEIEHTRRRR